MNIQSSIWFVTTMLHYIRLNWRLSDLCCTITLDPKGLPVTLTGEFIVSISQLRFQVYILSQFFWVHECWLSWRTRFDFKGAWCSIICLIRVWKNQNLSSKSVKIAPIWKGAWTRSRLKLSTEVEDVKYLGLTIDFKLRYDKYMLELVGKLNRAIDVLRRASKYIDQITRVMLCNTLILSHIDYCSTIWGSSISKQDIKKLQRLQNCSMRVILECHPRTHTKDMLDCLKWLSVEQRLDFNMTCLVWKIKKGKNFVEDLNVLSVHYNNNTYAL